MVHTLATSFFDKLYPTLDQNCLISIPCLRIGIYEMGRPCASQFFLARKWRLSPVHKTVQVIKVSCILAILGFSHVIKTKNRNRSINKVKNLGYDRWLQYKQPRQESGLCFFFNSRAIRRSVSSKFLEICMETPRWCPSGWAPTWRPETNRNICHWVLLGTQKH